MCGLKCVKSREVKNVEVSGSQNSYGEVSGSNET